MGKSCGNHGKIMGIFGRFRKGFLEAKRSQFWGRKNTTWQYVQCLPLMALITFSYTAIHPKSTQKEVPSQVLTNSGSTSAQGICNLSKWGLTDQAWYYEILWMDCLKGKLSKWVFLCLSLASNIKIRLFSILENIKTSACDLQGDLHRSSRLKILIQRSDMKWLQTKLDQSKVQRQINRAMWGLWIICGSHLSQNIGVAKQGGNQQVQHSGREGGIQKK